jgi:nitroimidazol reductase NimA-like FMN-containing flavoprotein (pyridoxamine 5'-phosphate oxidase superfamily)
VPFIDARSSTEIIARDECLDLLRGEVVGRIAVLDHQSPRIFPVNYVLDGDAIVFRSAPGTKVDDGPRGDACFEIDGFDREARTGWSVLVVGLLEEVTKYQSSMWARVQELPIDPWASGDKPHFLRLRPLHISGRRVR